MSSARLPLYVNPTAGRGRAGKRLPRIIELLEHGGIETTVRASSRIGDLEKQILKAVDAGASQILLAGGDGSIYEAANGVLRSRNDAAIGIIPTGTGNDFAKAADIPLDWETACVLLADRMSSNAPARRIDAGRMNDRFFVNGVGIGFDAKVTSIARTYRWPIGDFVYLLGIFSAMLDGIATPNLSIHSDDFEFEGPVTLASVCNGPYLGGMFHFAPMADNADGKLELLVVAPVTRRRIVSLLPKLMRGEHMNEAEVTHVSVRRLVIESEEAMPSHLDGEVQAFSTHFEIEILPEALRLI